MIDCFPNTDHHRTRGSQTQSMRFPMHHQPFVSFTLQRADRISDFVIQDLAASTWHRVQPCSFQPYENVANSQLRYPRDIQNLRRRETMTVDSEPLFNSREETLIIVDLQIGVNAALHEYSSPSERKRLLDLFVDNVIGKDVGLRVTFNSIERTECTEFFANIRVINVAIYDVADHIVRMKALTDPIRTGREVQQIGLLKKMHSLF